MDQIYTGSIDRQLRQRQATVRFQTGLSMLQLHEAEIQKVIAAHCISTHAIVSTLGIIFRFGVSRSGRISSEKLLSFVFLPLSLNLVFTFGDIGHEKHYRYYPHKQKDCEHNVIHSHPPKQVPSPRPVQDTQLTIGKVTSTLIICRCSVCGLPSCWLASQPVKIDPSQAAWRRRSGFAHPRAKNIQDVCPET
jgi:hypothetical protein